MNRRACVLFAPAILLAGCANPAPPRPPSLNLPRVSTDLNAQRQGPHVQLRWTVATYTTDNLLLPGARASATSYRKPHFAHPGALAAEVCREDIAAQSPCQPIARVTVHAGEHASWDDALPTSLQTGAPHLVAYKVRVLNAAGRDAGFSAPAFTASGEAPADMQDLHIRAVRQGAELKWTPSSRAAAGEEVRITREQTSAAKPAASSENKPVQMRIPASPDPGGAVDRGATAGSEFRYTAVRERDVSIAGQHLRIFGEPGTALSGVLTDSFPPPAPTGLVAISTPPTGQQKASIDLSWDPVTEQHLGGYFVYRADGNLAPQRISTTPVAGTSYHDEAVTQGHTYTYTVTAVDRTGNESPHSAPAEETIQ